MLCILGFLMQFYMDSHLFSPYFLTLSLLLLLFISLFMLSIFTSHHITSLFPFLLSFTLSDHIIFSLFPPFLPSSFLPPSFLLHFLYLSPSLFTSCPLSLSGIVRGAAECVELTSQKLGGKILFKRDLTLYDSSNTEVRLTLWGDKGDTLNLILYYVIQFHSLFTIQPSNISICLFACIFSFS